MGDGLAFVATTNLLSNTGVLSLQGDTGALSLSAGSGIGISGLTISNTGVLGVGGSTTSYLTGNIEFKSGSGISIAQSTTAITVGNTGVLSLQGDTGALSLGAGTGIGISGLTISNAGVTSITAGSNITISGSTGDVTINSASPAYTGGNGITFSGTTIEMSGSYSGEFDIETSISTTASTYANSLQYEINSVGRFYNQVYASEGKTANIDDDYWFVGWSSTGAQVLKVYGSGDMTLAGSLSAGSYNLAGGTGISFSGVTITNTGVTSLGAGTGISLSGSTGGITVTNSGVTSLQGDTGALSLSAGTGIGISGLTITNDGVTSLGAGTGISLSGSTGGITVTNSGVTSLQGDTGGLSLTANNGISISGLGIGMSGSYSGNLTINNNGDVQIGQTISNFSSIIHWGDNSATYGGGLVENYQGIQFLLANKSGSSYNGLNSNSYTIPFYIGVNGEAYTGNNLQETIGSNNNVSVRNTLDNGSGDMTVAGSLSVNGNITSNNNGGYVSAYNDQVLMFTGGSAVNGNGGSAGISIQGRPRIGDWGQWLTIGEPNGTNNGNIIQITSSGIFTGHSSGITTSPSIRNTLDDGSGNMSIAGYLIAHPTMGSNVVSGTLWNLSAASANVTFGSSNTGTVTLYIETIKGTSTGKYYVQVYNTTANNYPTFWATYLEANVTYYVGQTFVIGISGGDTIENWYAGGNAGGTLTVTGILNLG